MRNVQLLMASRSQARPRTWRRPCRSVGLHVNQSAADAWINWGSITRWDDPPTGLLGKLALPFGGYGEVAIYNVADATTTADVYWYTYDIGLPSGTVIPWNPAWTTSGSSDGFLLIDFTGQGELGDGVELWQCFGTDPSPRPWWPFPDEWQDVYGRGWRPGDVLAGTAVERTADNIGEQLSRGAGGIPKRAGLLVGAEIVAALNGDGVVHHALASVGVNHNAGPYAVANDLFSPPGTRVEWQEGQPDIRLPVSPDSRLYNEGTRFAHTRDAAGIESWLDENGYVDELRDTARVIAATLSYEYGYGCMDVETGTGQPLLECDPIESSAVWSNLGVTDATIANSLLDGLFTTENTVVLNPEVALQ